MQKKMLYALVSVIVAVIIIAAAAAILISAPATPPGQHPKYQLELWYNNDGHYGDTEPSLATVLKADIEACGRVEVTLKSDTWAAYKTRWSQGQMPAFLLGWYPDYFDSDDYVSPFLSTSGAASLGSFYTNATMDGWVTAEQTTTDPVARTTYFNQIQDKLAVDVPYVPLFTGNAHVAYVSSVQNVILHPVTFKWFIMNKPGAIALNASTTDKIVTLDPASAYDYFSIEIINNVFDNMLVYEPNTANLVPALVTRIPTVANGDVSADGLNYTYHLTPGLRFSDNTELNATVMKRSIDRAIRLDLPGSAAFLLYDVGGLTANGRGGNDTAPGVITVAPNDRDITFHLFKPVSFFNQLMAFSVSAPVPWNYNQNGEQPSDAASVLGNGPYMVTQHTPNQLIVLAANPNYDNPALYSSFGIPTIPVMSTVNVNIRSDATALKQDIETHTSTGIDVAYRTLTPTDLVDLQSRATALGITVDVGSSPQIRYIVFNTRTITDVRIRQAIAYSVNRANIDNTVFNGLVDPLYSMIPSSFPYAQPVFQTRYGGSPSCSSANNLLNLAGYVIKMPMPIARVARDARDDK